MKKRASSVPSVDTIEKQLNQLAVDLRDGMQYAKNSDVPNLNGVFENGSDALVTAYAEGFMRLVKPKVWDPGCSDYPQEYAEIIFDALSPQAKKHLIGKLDADTLSKVKSTYDVERSDAIKEVGQPPEYIDNSDAFLNKLISLAPKASSVKPGKRASSPSSEAEPR